MGAVMKVKAACVAVILILCVVLQPASAVMILSDEPEISWGSSWVLRAIVGGVAGFVVGGVVGGVMGAGLMAFAPQPGCSDDPGIGKTMVY